jgi:hypothetical protein
MHSMLTQDPYRDIALGVECAWPAPGDEPSQPRDFGDDDRTAARQADAVHAWRG